MEEIKNIRAKTGLNLTEFSKATKIPYRTLQDWEAGRRTCPEYVADLLKFRVENDPNFNK